MNREERRKKREKKRKLAHFLMDMKLDEFLEAGASARVYLELIVNEGGLVEVNVEQKSINVLTELEKSGLCIDDIEKVLGDTGE